ncbi:hypothetical protein [Thiosocius teredinicola]|uniref:hypothetical protein n=1 Tax=Thiosocius teredinicola TaxID=1973002 RepID=UPI000990E9B6
MASENLIGQHRELRHMAMVFQWHSVARDRRRVKTQTVKYRKAIAYPTDGCALDTGRKRVVKLAGGLGGVPPEFRAHRHHAMLLRRRLTVHE